MKKIEYGDSTSYELPMRFHYVEDQTQLTNVMEGVDKECFLQIGSVIDEEFNRLTFFMIKTDEPAINWLKYVVSSTLAEQFLTDVTSSALPVESIADPENSPVNTQELAYG